MAPKTREQYVRQILRRIRVTDGVKRRIRAALLADIAAKQDAGHTLAQTQAEMGSPDRAAAAGKAAVSENTSVTAIASIRFILSPVCFLYYKYICQLPKNVRKKVALFCDISFHLCYTGLRRQNALIFLWRAL